jgi:hypothetical protein
MSSSAFSRVPPDDQRVVFRALGIGVRDRSRRREEEERCDIIARNRAYYKGEQYDRDNCWQMDQMVQAGDLQRWQLLPEHLRLHPYSTQIADSVDFIANQLADGFTITSKDARVQRVIDDAVDNTELLRNDSDEPMAFDEIIVDGAQGGDVPYEVVWDPIEGVASWEFWPAEQVAFDVPTGSWVKTVTRRQEIIVEDTGANGELLEREVQETAVYDLALRDDGQSGVRQECRKRIYWDGDGEDDPRSVEWLGLPFIPWGVIKVDKKSLRGYRGDPLITKQTCQAADRYNANEQQAYLIARYNAHGNLGVVGDASYLKLQADDNKIPKDVSDVVGFPGGTQLYMLSLPTDPRMIEHTRQVTADQMYSSFGLVRVEPDTLVGLGTPSGYALEILNRKTDGTIRRIRRVIKTDSIRLVNLTLDVTAYRQGVAITDPILARALEDDPELAADVVGFIPERADWAEVDPAGVFPNRKIEIRMGSGYIVDEVMIRDDYVNGLISLEEALRRRGYDPDEVEQIIGEIDARAQKKMDQQLQIAGRTAQTVAEAQQQNSKTAQDAQRNGFARDAGSGGAALKSGSSGSSGRQKAGTTVSKTKTG